MSLIIGYSIDGTGSVIDKLLYARKTSVCGLRRVFFYFILFYFIFFDIGDLLSHGFNKD